ncbi:MAG: SDR family oxidoreductase, partial [Oscillospiraceae bacterium]|nr:SDR family oxidoreductase [Oscillospiraceae bacterium]
MIKTPPITAMSDAFSVAGKNVVVTGGNRGIGLGISTAFAECGANVAILCRNSASAEVIAADFSSKYGGTYASIACDISDSASVIAAAAKVFELFGTVDVLVNNAGIATTTPFLAENGLSEWHKVIDTNLHGTAQVVHAFAPKMRDAARGGSIINITSIGGQRVSNSRDHHNSPYNVSKAGLDIFTKYLAIVLGDYGIRV